MYRALVINKTDEIFSVELSDLDNDTLPEGDVTIEIEYSTLNYKDGLAITDSSPVVRVWPMVPGVDLAGTVSSSENEAYAVGDRVTVNGWDLGEKRWGGLATRTRVPASTLTKLPDSISTRDAMAIGTAGYTSMLCVLALEDHGVTPESGPIAVTGASGGVGSVAISLLNGLGYEVHAVTGRVEEQGDYLRLLGASQLVERSSLSEPARPVARATWGGAIDAAGGNILANLLSQTKPYGCIAACGLAASMDLPGSVAPFILRGITLQGIDSVHMPSAQRDQAWNRLAADLDRDALATMITEIGLDDVVAMAAKFMDGTAQGRIVVDVNN